MPGADIESHIASVTRAWNAHRDDSRLKVTVVMAVMVDATWPPGYPATAPESSTGTLRHRLLRSGGRAAGRGSL
jgi:hypothetical protein